jgi:predicted Holliday junction resolvase-like endonuclease
MLFSVIKQIILSIILIVIVHYIYVFLKDNLTQPKIKDLVNKPKMKYKEIYKSVEKGDLNDDLNKSNTAKMKTELQDYLKEISTKTPTDIAAASNNNLFDNNYESL